MNILLKPELEKFIDDQVQQGRYDSAADAINAAVARLQTEGEVAALSLDDLRAELDPALAEADRGEYAAFTAETVIAERRAAWAAKQAKGA